MIRNGLYGLIYSNLWVFVKRMRFQATGDINKISQKLDNKKFIENAPEELVSEQKELVAEKQSARDKLTAALKQLEAA